ncbi:hypothetical protein ABH940_003469 [Streptacidiphilus sp. BW17]|uniref:hypothetical protein n=1 Tax=Streptacidiphilus sp. BW17 TaxID=3156274 RepID=UPI0035173A05
MPTHYHDPLPDIAIGHHPDYGIVAANPKQLAASTWTLKRLDFRPVPDQPTLYALADQQNDGPSRTARAIALLRTAGYHVDVDPALASESDLDPEPRVEPDVAFAEHPRLGIVAATADTARAVERGAAVLEAHGWRFNHALDIYTLPTSTGRSEALGKVATATLQLHRADLQVAVQPSLAQEVTTHRAVPAATANHQRGSAPASQRFPRDAATLASSPAVAGLPGKHSVAAPTATAAAARPVDPRIAFARTH